MENNVAQDEVSNSKLSATNASVRVVDDPI